MTTPTSPFLEAARRFAENEVPEEVGACQVLYNEFGVVFTGTKVEYNFFSVLFHPTNEELFLYNTSSWFWLESQDRTPDQNRQDRIIALLLAHEIWCDENKLR